MTIFEIIVLAIIQGITEFLPISSSAHLLLPAELLGWKAQGLSFDVAVHVGSLLAVILYFRKDIVDLFWGWTRSCTGTTSQESSLAWNIIIATIPAIIVGLAAKSFIDQYARSIEVMATTTVAFGLLLWWADHRAKQINGLQVMGWKQAFVIGVAQIAALIPGTSRSGVTMTAGLMLGFDRESAARFSFLLSIPTILGAGTLVTLDLLASDEAVVWLDLALGAVLSFVSAYLCIVLFLKWISRIGMLPFVIYRLALGAMLFAIILL